MIQAALLICWAVLWGDLPSWALVASGVIITLRFGVEKSLLNLPPRWLINLAAITAVIFVAIEYRSVIGREPSSTLIVLLSAFKFLEMRTPRDRKFLQVLILGLIAVKFLFSFDLWILFPSLMALFCLLISFMSDSYSIRYRALWVLKNLLWCLPLATLLFFTFPRNKSPLLWRHSKVVAETGFSKSLSPGSVSSLLLNRSLVFRFESSDILSASSELYFKGAVLRESKGLEWDLGPRHIQDNTVSGILDLPKYRITLETQSGPHLFVLDGTVTLDSDIPVKFFSSGDFELRVTPQQRLTYTGYIKEPKSEGKVYEQDLQVPQIVKEISEELKIFNLSQNADERYLSILNYFKRNSYAYSNQVSVGIGIEDFLRKERLGYCEHFAGATASLLRAGGVPARVIVGYAGGQWNSVGSFLSVTQDRAHAWVEYFDGTRWKRADPTRVIAPNYLNTPLEDEWWDQITFYYETLNHRWNTFLIEYDRTEQRRFLSENIKWVILFFLGGLFLMFIVTLWPKSTPRKSLSEKLLADLFAHAQKNWGIQRGKSEAPLDFLKRLPIKSYNALWELYYIEVYLEEGASPELQERAKNEYSEALQKPLSRD